MVRVLGSRSVLVVAERLALAPPLPSTLVLYPQPPRAYTTTFDNLIAQFTATGKVTFCVPLLYMRELNK
uniref:MCD domain-containing protein n=1 Tax=Echinococcus granulosus TaxID=6210 RepID=A0A068WDT1_ECHGR|nr:hypothetical protein EgrG_002020700 [Echinococcus granulosus]